MTGFEQGPVIFLIKLAALFSVKAHYFNEAGCRPTMDTVRVGLQSLEIETDHLQISIGWVLKKSLSGSF